MVKVTKCPTMPAEGYYGQGLLDILQELSSLSEMQTYEPPKMKKCSRIKRLRTNSKWRKRLVTCMLCRSRYDASEYTACPSCELMKCKEKENVLGNILGCPLGTDCLDNCQMLVLRKGVLK